MRPARSSTVDEQKTLQQPKGIAATPTSVEVVMPPRVVTFGEPRDSVLFNEKSRAVLTFFGECSAIPAVGFRRFWSFRPGADGINGRGGLMPVQGTMMRLAISRTTYCDPSDVR